MRLLLCFGALAAVLVGSTPASAGPAHVVVVIEENHDYSQIIGSSSAPYINNTLVSGGLLLTDSHGVGHPSQPNYLELYSGSNQGVTGDYHLGTTFTTPNLGASLIQAGKSFAIYSQGLPSTGYTGDNATSSGSSVGYARKHNPYVDWQGSGTNGVPASGNLPFSSFPSDYSQLPTVSFVVPDQVNDMHGVPPYTTPDSTVIQTGDTWLQNNIDGYAQWAKNNNSLLIVTWDENDFTTANHVATIFYGAGITPGSTYGGNVNHYNILRTIEDFYGLTPIGNSATAPAVPTPEPSSIALAATGLLSLAGWGIRSRTRKAVSA